MKGSICTPGLRALQAPGDGSAGVTRNVAEIGRNTGAGGKGNEGKPKLFLQSGAQGAASVFAPGTVHERAMRPAATS